MRGFGQFLAAAVLAVVAVAPAAAQAQGYSQQRLIDAFDHATFTATLAETGASWETSETGDGTDFYQITFGSGLKAFGYFAACDGGDCRGLTLIALYTPPEGFSTAELDEIVRVYNDTYSAGKAFRGEDGSLLVQGYVIADHGITMGNLLLQIQVFEDLAEKFAEGFDE